MRDSHFPVTIKTSAPSLDGVIERPRLIDSLAKLPATAKWLQAPSGTGKSTLAASYARTLKKPLAWYRLDDRDNDPVFFYAEFAQAVRTQLRLKEQLPKFSSDDHERQLDFARYFAAALSEQVAKPALIVVDDMQCVTSAEMQRALAAIVETASSGVELLLVSQTTAPTSFFDAIAARRLALLNDADLRFEVPECKAMIAALRISDAHSEGIAALTGGHAGALVLACELLRGTDPQSALGIETVDRIHTHLLTKLVERMSQPRRELLLRTAFVPQLTRSIAEALAGADAARELGAVVDSGLLRRVGDAKNEVFEAHGLVQQGVRALARTRFGEVEAQRLADMTATTLIAHDQAEAAFTLLVEVGSARAIEVLEQLAERYAAQGQTDLLLNSLAKIPEIKVRSNAWLCFWAGQALLRVEEEQARVWLGHSYSAFEAAGDASGMRLAASNIVIAFALEWADMQQLDTWIDRHMQAGGDEPVSMNDRFEVNLLMGLVCAALVRGRYPPRVDADAVIGRIRRLLESQAKWLSDDQRVQAATVLIKHGHAFAKIELSRNVITATRSLIDAAVGGMLHRGRWLVAAADTLFAGGDATLALAHMNEARSLAEQSQSHRLHFEVAFASANHAMKSHDLPRAAAELDRLEQVVMEAPPTQRAEYARMKARLLLLRGRLPEGLQWAQEAMRMAAGAGLTSANLRMFEIELVYALAANDQLTEALEIVSRQEYEPSAARHAMEHCLRYLVDGDTQNLSLGLQCARQIDFVNLLDRARAPLTRICEAALANDIETEFVLRLIKIKQLKPSPLAGPSWPWLVHIRTLGGFRLDIQGKPYQPPRKAQDKPLELLKLLVTCQAMGRDSAEKGWIAERLWPDAEAENARKSLDMTIGRLRRLLGNDETILTSDGRLQLSPAEVWTDLKPLFNAISQAQLRRDEYMTGQRPSYKEAATNISSVFDNYRGQFLADEDAPAWLLAGREAIAARVRQVLLAADAILDGSADDVLVPALQRALLADPTSEDLAQALMRAHLRNGRNSETVNVYRQLREMLSLVLGIAPSSETDHIRDQAYAANSTKSASPHVAAQTVKEIAHGRAKR